MPEKPAKIKVLIIEQTAELGGAQVNHVLLHKYLDKTRFELGVVCPGEGLLTEALREFGPRIHLLSMPSLPSTSFYFSRRRIFNPVAFLYDLMALMPVTYRLRRILAREKPDIVMTNGMLAHFYGGLASKSLGVPCIWHLDDIVRQSLLWGAMRIFFRFFSGLLARYVLLPSEAVRAEAYPNGRCKTRCQVIHNGVDLSLFGKPAATGIRSEFNIPVNAPLVAILSRLTPWKGHREFIQAAKIVARTHPHCHFLIVGGPLFGMEGYERELRQMAAASGIAENIHFAGFRRDMPAIVADMDVGVLPSLMPEPFGRVLIEGMAAGKPFVAANHGGVPEIIENGRSGLLVSPGDVQALAEAVTALVADPKRRSEIGLKAKEYVENRFSAERFALEHGRAFEMLLNGGFPSERTPRVFFVYQSAKSFVNKDKAALKEHFPFEELENYPPSISKMGRLWRGVRESDVVFLWFLGRHAVLPLLLAKMLRKKIIIVAGGWDVAKCPEIGYGLMQSRFPLNRICRWLLGLAETVVSVSGSNMREAAFNGGVPQSKLRLIYHGFEAIAAETGPKENLVITVGDVSLENLKRKGHEDFIRTAALCPEFSFRLIGKWLDMRAVNYLKSISPPNVQLTGYVDDSGLAEQMRKAAVYLQLSRHEAFGCSVAEAMLYKCVPVVTNAYALPEVVGDAGYVVECGNISMAEKKVREAFLNPEIGRQARERVMSEFPLSRRRDALAELVRSVMRGAA